MNKIIKLSLVFILFLIFSGNNYSQFSINPDSLTAGLKYKFVLYDEKVVIAKVIRTDSIYIHAVNNDGSYRLKKDDIFFITRDIGNTDIKAVFSAGGGLSFFNSEQGGYLNEYKGKYSLQVSALLPFGENKGVRLDAGYSRWKRDGEISPGGTVYTDAVKEFYYIKGDYVFGSFAPSEKFWMYGTAGLGIQLIRYSPYSENWSYYSGYDSAYHSGSYYHKEEKYTSMVLSLGASIGYRFTKKLGIYFDAQLNTVNYGFFFLFWGGSLYFPVRAGITYTIY